MSDSTWLIISFVAMLIPALIFMVVYATWTRWEDSPAGRVLLFMAFVMVVSYSLSLLTLTFPSFFQASLGVSVRVTVRLLLAIMQWSLVWLLFRAQRLGPRRKEPKK